MTIKDNTKQLIKSQRVAGVSCIIYALLSFAVQPSIAIVPAFSFLFAFFYFEKSLVSKNNVNINIPFYTIYNYLIPFILFGFLAGSLYLKIKHQQIIPPISFVLLIFPVFLYFQKVIMKMIVFPTKISNYGLSDSNYTINLDFKNNIFYGQNDLINFDDDLIIKGSGISLEDLYNNKVQYEEFLGKPISEFTIEDINLAKLYHY